jgi:hypothetical protein
MNELESQVLRLIGENAESPDVFTEDSGISSIRESLNDAVEELCLLTGSVKRNYQLIAKTGETFYRLAFNRDQYGWVTDAWLPGFRRRLEQTDIQRLNTYNPRWMQNVGTPQAYFPIGSNIIGLWPAPGGNNMMIELTCVIITQRYTSADERIKIRTAWQDIAVHFGAAEYYASTGDVTNAMGELQHFIGLAGILAGYDMSKDYRWKIKTEKEYYPRPTE